MSSISLLDCTLRDGGHVNDFNFGADNIKKIISYLTESNAEIIEIGFLKNADFSKNKSIFEYVDQADELLENYDGSSKYSLMIRPDWYDIKKLRPSKFVKLLRFAFYKEDLELALEQARIARDMGYEVFMNPVNITGYEPSDINSVLAVIADFEPTGVSIVDTFGSLTESMLLPIFKKFDEMLAENVTIGLHLHENLALSFSLAQRFLSIKASDRKVVVDSSVLGMGRIPGNLPTELLMQYLNLHYGKNYQLNKVLSLVGDPISEIKKDIPWGYSPEYAMSAFYGIHRSYPEYLIGTLGCSQEQAFDVMQRISAAGKGNKFLKEVADSLVQADKSI